LDVLAPRLFGAAGLQIRPRQVSAFAQFLPSLAVLGQLLCEAKPLAGFHDFHLVHIGHLWMPGLNLSDLSLDFVPVFKPSLTHALGGPAQRFLNPGREATPINARWKTENLRIQSTGQVRAWRQM
jgi:hypothetical protein